MRDMENVDWSAYGKYVTTIFTEKAEALIQTHDPSKPFFLYMSHLVAHVGNIWAPLQAPNATIAKFTYIVDPERRKRAGNIYILI